MKSKEKHHKVEDLRKVFVKYRRYNLQMNPLKCAFGVSLGKILGFAVHQKGIDLDLAKTRAIQVIGPLMTCKQLKSFIWRVSYVCRFILALAELLETIQPTPKKNVLFRWGDEQ